MRLVARELTKVVLFIAIIMAVGWAAHQAVYVWLPQWAVNILGTGIIAFAWGFLVGEWYGKRHDHPAWFTDMRHAIRADMPGIRWAGRMVALAFVLVVGGHLIYLAILVAFG